MDWRYLVLIPALGPLVFYGLAIYAGLSYFRRLRRLPPANRVYAPAVSILKPVRGVDREAYENFASFCDLDYPEYEILFAIAEANDPAIAIIQRLQKNFPEQSIQLIVGIEQLGITRKTNSLVRLAREAKYDLLAISDSDVRVERDYLREVVAPFVDPEVGVVTAFFRGLSPKSFCSELDAVGYPTDAAANTLVAKMLGNIDFALGWTMATRKEQLREIGGFESLINHHSDDFALGNEIFKRGYRIELLRKPVWMVFEDESMSEFLKHELRWSILLKNLRPAGYAAMAMTFGLPWALLVALVVPSRVVGAGYFLAYLVSRLLVAWIVGVWGLDDPTVRRKIWLVPVRDAVSFGIYVASFFSNTVQWRGFKYRVQGPSFVPVEHDK
ncbi:MAG TPA: bacteriohopanetetrol glucosamine biosynthesis glycosyltransferase HpnI [Candidatus Dormibacteraeota bacterium]|nr:bacteriohopanetetrol glucosamine biosynthesis glycosyltransferase HpnI [Candidatus Dormibacteraeota bacterium]